MYSNLLCGVPVNVWQLAFLEKKSMHAHTRVGLYILLI